jgi:hypothetical protein
MSCPETGHQASQFFTVCESDRRSMLSSLAAILAAQFGDWKLLFLVFGIVQYWQCCGHGKKLKKQK